MSVRRLKTKLAIFVTVCLLAMVGWTYKTYQALPDERLLGDWKVDADATLKDWNGRSALSETRAQFWRDTWRDVQVTYYKDRYVTQFRSEARRQYFSTRTRTKDQVVIREVRDGKLTDVAIHFEGANRIWVAFAEGDARRQYYTRAVVEEDPSTQRSSSRPGLAAIGVQ